MVLTTDVLQMRRKCAPPKDIHRGQLKPPSAISPFHEAMHRRTRRIRHSWQVFGLAGTHPSGAPSGRRFPVRCGPVQMTAVVPAYRCGTVPDSHRVPSRDAPVPADATRCRDRGHGRPVARARVPRGSPQLAPRASYSRSNGWPTPAHVRSGSHRTDCATHDQDCAGRQRFRHVRAQ